MNTARRFGTAAMALAPGAVTFAAMYWSTLVPGRAAWVFAEHPRTADLATSQLGWMYFNDDLWRWPLGSNPHYGGLVGNSMLYSDSIPSVAVPLKLLFAAWPTGTPSQIAGLSLLIGLLMMSVLSFKLLSLWVSGNEAIPFIGTFFFVLAPRLLDSWAISSLFPQWVIVGALLIISLDLNIPRRTGSWCLLVFVSIGINPYVTAALFVLSAGDFAVRGFAARRLISALWGWLATIGMGVFGFWTWGGFAIPLSSGAAGSSLGAYSANVLSLVDPGGYSRFIGDLSGGTGEGFNYVGAGILALLVSAFGAWLFNRTRSRGRAHNPLLCTQRRQSIVILTATTIPLAVFATLPVLSIGSHVWTLPVPGPFAFLFEVFRSNARFMWPLMYAVILAGVALGSRINRRHGAVILLAGLVIQMLDLVPLMSSVREQVGRSTSSGLIHQAQLGSVLSSPDVAALEVIPAFPYPPDAPWREVGFAAFEAGLPLGSLGALARYDAQALLAVRGAGLVALETGALRADTVYMVSDDLYLQHLAGRVDVRDEYVISGWHFVRMANPAH
jgi:hypothetical protein